jgi:hypothetical protein
MVSLWRHRPPGLQVPHKPLFLPEIPDMAQDKHGGRRVFPKSPHGNLLLQLNCDFLILESNSKVLLNIQSNFLLKGRHGTMSPDQHKTLSQ